MLNRLSAPGWSGLDHLIASQHGFAHMKSLVKKTRAKRLIAKWWQDHKEPIRAAMYSREVEKIKTFYEETKNQEAVMPKIRRFKRAVLYLQREMRGVLHRCEKTRKRLLAQYDKVEKKTLVELVRERIKSIDDAAKAAARMVLRGLFSFMPVSSQIVRMPDIGRSI